MQKIKLLSVFVLLLIIAKTTAAYDFRNDLEIGVKGDEVVKLQSMLIDGGYLSIPSDYELGYFGKLTELAVAKWQIANNVLPISGYFGPKSRKAANLLSVGDSEFVLASSVALIGNKLNQEQAEFIVAKMVSSDLVPSSQNNIKAKLVNSFKETTPEQVIFMLNNMYAKRLISASDFELIKSKFSQSSIPAEPTISLLINGKKSERVEVGSEYTYSWSSTLGKSAKGAWKTTSGDVSVCGTSGTLRFMNTLNGSRKGETAITSKHAGCVWEVTFEVTYSNGTKKTDVAILSGPVATTNVTQPQTEPNVGTGKSFEITYPNGGEKLYTGYLVPEKVSIRWASADSVLSNKNVDIYWKDNKGGTWLDGTKKVSNYKLDHTFPFYSGSGMYKIVAKIDGRIVDESDNWFEVKNSAEENEELCPQTWPKSGEIPLKSRGVSIISGIKSLVAYNAAAKYAPSAWMMFHAGNQIKLRGTGYLMISWESEAHHPNAPKSTTFAPPGMTGDISYVGDLYQTLISNPDLPKGTPGNHAWPDGSRSNLRLFCIDGEATITDNETKNGTQWYNMMIDVVPPTCKAKITQRITTTFVPFDQNIVDRCAKKLD